jgi:hypothetical protein
VCASKRRRIWIALVFLHEKCRRCQNIRSGVNSHVTYKHNTFAITHSAFYRSLFADLLLLLLDDEKERYEHRLTWILFVDAKKGIVVVDLGEGHVVISFLNLL